jgi:hypothetical protein
MGVVKIIPSICDIGIGYLKNGVGGINANNRTGFNITVMNTLATRAFRISNDEHLEEEKKHLLNVFKNNGYKKHQVTKDFQNATKTPRNKEQTNNDVSKVYLPYIQGTTNKLARILKKKNIGATFKPLNTIRNSLRLVKTLLIPLNIKVSI